MIEYPDGWDAMSDDAQAAYQAFMDSDEHSYYAYSCDYCGEDLGDSPFNPCMECGAGPQYGSEQLLGDE